MKKITALYGGTCTYTINLTASTKYGKRKFFEIEISNSDVLNENGKWAEMCAANMAYVFFTFVKEDKTRYDAVKSSIVYRDGTKLSFDYSFDTLNLVNKKMAYVRRIISVLGHEGIERINEMLKPGIFANKNDQSNYFNNLASADSTFGRIIDFTFTGFKFNTATNGIHLLHVSGDVKRSKQDTQFSIDISPSIGRDELYLIEYTY